MSYVHVIMLTVLSDKMDSERLEELTIDWHDKLEDP